jgi:hypothetical protein
MSCTRVHHGRGNHAQEVALYVCTAMTVVDRKRATISKHRRAVIKEEQIPTIELGTFNVGESKKESEQGVSPRERFKKNTTASFKSAFVQLANNICPSVTTTYTILEESNYFGRNEEILRKKPSKFSLY